MKTRCLAAWLWLGAGLISCATTRAPIVGELADGPLTRHGVLHVVKKGQTLWRIAHTYRVAVQELAEVNDLPDPTKIAIGQALWIPGADRALDVPLAPAVATTPPPPHKHAVSSHPATATVEKEPAPPAPPEEEETPIEVKHTRFIWPVKGPLGSRFGVRGGTQHDGIDIDAPKGTPILAADAGEVLYAGQQRGYGNLVLLRHSDNLITVYAHNEENRVKAGEQIRKGSEIAIVGDTGRATGPHLHFEVRQDRIPRNPLFFLP